MKIQNISFILPCFWKKNVLSSQRPRVSIFPQFFCYSDDLLGDDLGDHSLADYNLGNDEEDQLLADDFESGSSQNVPSSISSYDGVVGNVYSGNDVPSLPTRVSEINFYTATVNDFYCCLLYRNNIKCRFHFQPFYLQRSTILLLLCVFILYVIISKCKWALFNFAISTYKINLKVVYQFILKSVISFINTMLVSSD